MKPEDDSFERRVKASLDASVHGLDASTRCRLNAIRHAALQHGSSPRWLPFRGWMLAAVAACALLAVALFAIFPQQPARDQIALQDTDAALELLLSDDAHEELVDPDFYVWMDEILLAEEEAEHAG